MNRFCKMMMTLGAAALVGACSEKKAEEPFRYTVDSFADLKVMRYQVPGWDSLSLKQKEYAYHLAEAAKYGRDILWDQNCKDNLRVRHAVENILENYKGDRKSADFEAFTVYAKRLFFSNGMHHHYAEDKFFPACPQPYFAELLKAVGIDDDDLLDVIYNPERYPQRRSTETSGDIVALSAVNFYDGVTRDEVEKYYAGIVDPKDDCPISYGLNTKVVKGADGIVRELPWKVGGIYSPALEKICDELLKARAVAENDIQARALGLLVDYYRTGDLRKWDEFNIEWVKDTLGTVDFINGFVEDYNDPLGRKGAWEGYVNIKDFDASRRTETLSANAQWFEDHSPVDPRFRKATVKGVSAKVINAVCLAGDSYPSTPIGINLPNADWSRSRTSPTPTTIPRRNSRRACSPSSPGTRRKSPAASSGAPSPTRSIPTCTNAWATAPASCCRASPPRRWANTPPPWRKPAPTCSASITRPIRRWSNWASCPTRRPTRPNMTATSATA